MGKDSHLCVQSLRECAPLQERKSALQWGIEVVKVVVVVGGWFQIFKPFHENLGHVLLILVGSQDIYEEVEGFGDLEIWNLMQNNSAR